jgi:hypothetical protein
MADHFGDLEFAEEMCRLDEQAEHHRSISLDVCSMVVANSIEWLPAAEWVKPPAQGANK